MQKILLATVALMGLFAIATPGAQAAPISGRTLGYTAQSEHLTVPVDYYWNRRHWHHRRWHGGRWRYYD